MAQTQASRPDDAKLGKLRRHVRILADLGRLAGENMPLDRLLDQACVQVARAVEIDHVKLMRYRRRTADLFMEAGMGWKEGVVRAATFPTGLRSPPGRAYQTGEPVVIDDTASASGFVISDVLKEHGIVSLANVPVFLDGAAWGVLEVDSSTRCDFSEDTITFMMAAATVIGTLVQRRTLDRSEAETAATIAAQAQAREVLLREMQHRVKNNFQLILASIAIQKRRFESADVQRVLDHVANRINAISLAHDQLSLRPGDLHVVDVASYLRALCASIQAGVENVAVEVEADEIELTIDRAVPLGLILNEAATNSVKHAFGPEGGRINVKLTSGVGYGEARLTVVDDGHGIENPRPGGSGQKLIHALARQIGGEIEQQTSDRGTSTSVTFPIIS
jgi:two-component sensor histidine kinase/putative methionine-R-sulfoxide reductase with GAF domain